MEYFFKNNNNNNTNNINNFNQNYGDNKRHIYQSSRMTENTLPSNDPDPVFEEFVDTENQLIELMRKKTNDANWDLLEKLLEDGVEYEQALDQVYKVDNKNKYKTNDTNYISNQTTSNRTFRHHSPTPDNIKWNTNLNEEKSRTHCSPVPENIDWNTTLNEEIPIRQDMSYNIKKATRNSLSFGDYMSSNNNYINANDNEKYDPLRSKPTLNSSVTNNSDNRDIFQRSDIAKQDISRYPNEPFKRSERRRHNYRNYEDDNREFSDYQTHELSYADRRKLNIFLDDGHTYEEALSYVLKHKDENPNHTVTHSSQHTSIENFNNLEFDKQNWRRNSEIDTKRNRSYEEDMIDNDGVALIDEEIKRKRVELELYENRLLRYSQKLIKTESKSSRSSSREKREADNYSINNPVKLSGAGRKRIRILMKKMRITYDEALPIVLNERMERERTMGRRYDGNIKRENIDNRNDINDKSKRRRIDDDIREDYVKTEEMSQHDEFEYHHSKRQRHYSRSQDRDAELQEEQIRNKCFEENERVKPLSGAGRKRIARLVVGGMPLEQARAIVIQERDHRNARLAAKPQQLNESRSNKNMKLEKFKKEELSSSGIKVYIHNKNYPDEKLDNDELDILKRAILYELDRVSPREPVVRFLSCVFKLGWLQIICADDYSCDWLANIMKTLRPWRGASLKMIAPGESTVLVHIMEPDSYRKVLDNLKKQNQGLNTENWIVLRVIHAKKGNLYIFDIDDFSLETLESNNLTAFYGLGKVKFRLKKENRPFESTESRQRNTQKPLKQRHLPGIRGRGSVDFEQNYRH